MILEKDKNIEVTEITEKIDNLTNRITKLNPEFAKTTRYVMEQIKDLFENKNQQTKNEYIQ